MSVAVSLDELQERMAEVGGDPFLVTIGADQRAHVVSVHARVEGSSVVARAGSTSRGNVDANPAVTLLWSPADGGDYSLIVDGNGVVVGDAEVAVSPTRAVLHRLAGASDDLPSCIALDGRH
jgi:hypothetical protein